MDYRRLSGRLVACAFRDVAGQVVEAFVAAPMSYGRAPGLVYGAQREGPAAGAMAGAVELAPA